MSNLLSDQFLSKYSDFPQHMSELGQFVFYRTYSRWLEEKNRRETWKETVRRAVEYNCSLVPDVDQEEAEKLFDNMFNLRQFCSGRTLWVGGTEASKRFPASNFNCSFCIIDDFEAIYDLFYLLMVGTGVGFRILKSDVEKLPRMRDDVELVILPYSPIHEIYRSDVTTLEGGNQDLIIKVGDSKEGER